MRILFTLIISIFCIGQSVATAQMGLNSISVATTLEGNVAWSANYDGHNRKGYLDKQSVSEGICNKPLEKDVLIPVQSTSYFHTPSDVLFFTGTGYDHFSVTIKDESGNVVANDQYFESTSMDISFLSSGTYTIEIVAEKTQEVKTKKFTKE